MDYGIFWQVLFQQKGCWISFLLLHVPCFIETPVVNENSADLNQMQYLI